MLDQVKLPIKTLSQINKINCKWVKRCTPFVTANDRIFNSSDALKINNNPLPLLCAHFVLIILILHPKLKYIIRRLKHIRIFHEMNWERNMSNIHWFIQGSWDWSKQAPKQTSCRVESNWSYFSMRAQECEKFQFDMLTNEVLRAELRSKNIHLFNMLAWQHLVDKACHHDE